MPGGPKPGERNPMPAYYLHQVKTIRDTIIVVDNTPVMAATVIYINDQPVIDADGKPVPNQIGWTLGPVETRNEAEVLSLAIAKRYNYDILIDGQLLNLPLIDRSQAASAMGSVTGGKKAAASRENGARGGRPRKQK
jgi:hypothetical protein